MARGGYRPGAGRKRLTDEEKAERARLRAEAKAAAGLPVVKAAAKKPARKTAPAAKLPSVVGQPQDALPPEDKAAVEEAALMADMTPIAYMLHVMRNPQADPIRRDRMAIAAAPFCHHRKEPVGQGKKEAAAAAAKEAAGSSRLRPRPAPTQPPQLRAVNGGK